MAADEGIIFFCSPPHTTHILQPLDNGTFASLKACWRQECQKVYSENPGTVLNRRNFMVVFQKAWVKGMSTENIVSYFKSVGLYPVNRRVVLSKLEPDHDINIISR